MSILEPEPEHFDAQVLELALYLCTRAEAESRTDEFHLAAPQAIVDSIFASGRDRLARVGIEWLRSAQGLRTCSGLRVSAGPKALAAADYEEVVVVCSGGYPDRGTLARVSACTRMSTTASVTLVFDLQKPPTRAEQLRELVARLNLARCRERSA